MHMMRPDATRATGRRRAWSASPAITAGTVFLAALGVRLLAALVLWGIAPQPVETLLGPDSRGYFQLAQALAERHFDLPAHPAVVLGTFNVAPYYLFGLVIWLGGGLLQLQILNGLLGALAAALTYAAARRVVPAYAVAAGLIVAFNPSLIALSSIGLLKDPSVMCASAMVLCGVAVGWSDPRVSSRARRALPWLLVVVGLAYLRMSRFYTAAYFEAGLAAAAIVAIYRGAPGRRMSVAVPALLAIAGGELIPIVLGWPSSPRMLYVQIGRVLGLPGMMYGSEGQVDTWLAAAAGSDEAVAIVRHAADAVSRTFGPYVWVPPTVWDRQTLLYANDFVLYPGMLLWYAMQPYLVVGMWAAWRTIRTADTRGLWLVVLALFALVYLVQYELINLSYRQREAMFPVFLLIAIVGYLQSREWRAWRTWYVGYCLCLAAVAVAHLTLRYAAHG